MAEDRKARLAALASKSGRNIPCAADSEPSGESKPKISFRNYVPKDASLTPAVDTDGQSSSEQPSTKRLKPTIKGDGSKSILEQALAKTSVESRQAAGQSTAIACTSWSTITPVQSKKVNWDLKRDIADKMDKLEKRTQKAIVEMLRERLEREAAEEGEDDSD
jgi:coiled-coil domain-containing protein 12